MALLFLKLPKPPTSGNFLRFRCGIRMAPMYGKNLLEAPLSQETNLLFILRPPRGLHSRPRAGRGEGSQHLDQVQRVLRRLLVVHGGGHGVLHQAIAVQDDDPLQALALLLVIQIKPGGQLTAGVRPQGETQTSAQSSVLPAEIFNSQQSSNLDVDQSAVRQCLATSPGSFQPRVVSPGTVRGAGHHRGPRLGKALLEAGEGEEELLRCVLPVSAVEDDDEVSAAVLRQTVGRLSALVNSRDVTGRTRA